MMLSGSATWVVFEITTPNNESYKRLQSKRPEQISQRPGRATVQKMPKPQHSPDDKSKLPSPRPFRVNGRRGRKAYSTAGLPPAPEITSAFRHSRFVPEAESIGCQRSHSRRLVFAIVRAPHFVRKTCGLSFRRGPMRARLPHPQVDKSDYDGSLS
jgi:hypothetical protein